MHKILFLTTKGSVEYQSLRLPKLICMSQSIIITTSIFIRLTQIKVKQNKLELFHVTDRYVKFLSNNHPEANTNTVFVCDYIYSPQLYYLNAIAITLSTFSRSEFVYARHRVFHVINPSAKDKPVTNNKESLSFDKQHEERRIRRRIYD